MSAQRSGLRKPEDQERRAEQLRLAAQRAAHREIYIDPEADAERDAEKFARALKEGLEKLPNPK